MWCVCGQFLCVSDSICIWIHWLQLCGVCSPPRTLQGILEKICKEVDEYSEYLMEVRREHILSDCLRNVASHDFHPTKCIKVQWLLVLYISVLVLLLGCQCVYVRTDWYCFIAGCFHWRRGGGWRWVTKRIVASLWLIPSRLFLWGSGGFYGFTTWYSCSAGMLTCVFWHCTSLSNWPSIHCFCQDVHPYVLL